MARQPVPKSKSLIEEIKRKLFLNENKLSDFDYARFKKMAEMLKRSEPDYAYSALGILECVKRNEEECIANHEKSLLCTRHPSVVLQNYANSMRFLGRYADSARLALRSWKVDPANTTSLGLVIDSYFELGDEESFLFYAKKWEDLTGGEHELMQEYREELEEANSLSNDCMVISDDGFKELQ